VRTTSPPPRRRGRPRLDEVEERRAAVIEAALEVLVEQGYAGTTMSAIAHRAGTSKETLYSWFGDRAGLFGEMIRHNADQAAERVTAALAGADDHVDTLVGFGVGLIRLLTGPPSIELNKAAMSDESLAAELLASGRHRVGPIVEGYLARLDDAGFITVHDGGEAFEALYGLLVRDTQIRVLLGEAPLSASAITTRATVAVEQFLALYGRRH
jgi:AcrR family transcriptional regulator